MLKDFVCETSSAPGTAATINLAGALTGRVTFKAAGIENGAQTFYFMEDGTSFECGVGVLTHGAPDTLNRQTPTNNSLGTTARINFTGSVRVYCAVPSARMLWRDASGNLDIEGRFISALWWAGNSAGTATAYSITLPKVVTAYAGGFEFRYRAHVTCGNNPTIDAGQGAKALYRPTSYGLQRVLAGEIVLGQLVHVIYDPTTLTFVMVSAPPGAGSYHIGDFVFGAWSSLPPGCLWPDGRNVSRTTYAALFAEIGTTYGTGDGSTTFGLPDVRGRSLFGKDNLGGTAANRITNAIAAIVGTTLGASGGSQSMQSHGHNLTDPGHIHVYYDRINAGSAEPNVNGTSPGGSDLARGSDAAMTGITVQSTGAGGSQNMPPAIISNIAIYAGAA